MKLTSLALFTVFVVAGCAHSKAPDTDRLSRMTPEVVAHENLHRLGAMGHTAMVDEEAVAELRVCVTPAGAAESVELAKSSGSAWFDRAAADELKSTRFARFSAPAHIRVCSPVRVVVAEHASRY